MVINFYITGPPKRLIMLTSSGPSKRLITITISGSSRKIIIFTSYRSIKSHGHGPRPPHKNHGQGCCPPQWTKVHINYNDYISGPPGGLIMLTISGLSKMIHNYHDFRFLKENHNIYKLWAHNSPNQSKLY